MIVERAETAARSTPDRPGRLDLATGLLRLLAGTLTDQVERLAAAMGAASGSPGRGAVRMRGACRCVRSPPEGSKALKPQSHA
jgi:hypothetical protein